MINVKAEHVFHHIWQQQQRFVTHAGLLLLGYQVHRVGQFEKFRDVAHLVYEYRRGSIQTRSASRTEVYGVDEQVQRNNVP